MARAEYGLVLLDTVTGTYWNLDEIGSRVLSVLQGAKTIAEVSVEVSKEFDAASELIAHDLRALLTEMREAGLVDEL